MFTTIINPSSGVPRQRWTTTVLSAAAHVAVMIAVVLSTLYATDVLPEPRETMAFFVAAPVPPPPPPPAPAAEPEPKRVTPAVRKAVTPRPAPVIAKAPIAAPIEAPSSITPETGLEGGEFTPSAIEAGFETGIPGGVAGGIAGGFVTAPPAPPPAPAAPVRVGGAISAPRLLHRVEPEYPLVAVNAQLEGIVIIEATVDETGAVTDTRVLRANPLLSSAAVRAVEQWRYEPLQLNGKAAPFMLSVTVSFSLGNR
jgi:protein TonB